MSRRVALFGVTLAVFAGLAIWLVAYVVSSDAPGDSRRQAENAARQSDGTRASAHAVDPSLKGIETAPVPDGEETPKPTSSESGEAILVGRVVDGARVPLPDYSVQIAIQVQRSGVTRQCSGGVRTDDRGRWRFRVSDPGATLKRLTLNALGSAGELSAVIHVDRALPDGETDLGDILLEPSEFSIAGRVIDSLGRPIQEARISVEYRYPGHAGRAHWDSPLGMVRHCGKDGTFALRGPPHEDLVRVRVSCKGYVTAVSDAVRAGSRGVQVVLLSLGSIAGSVRLPESVHGSQLEVVFRGRVPGLDFATQARSFADESGLHPFTSMSLTPGTYDVEFRLLSRAAGDRRALARVRDVVVRSGEVSRDRRLQGLDLTGLFTVLRLRVVDSEDRPIGSARASIEHTGESYSAWGGSADREGRISVPTTQSGVHLWVAAPGYRPRDLGVVTGDRKVVLQGGYPVKLALHLEEPLPDGVRMSLSIQFLQGLAGRRSQKGPPLRGRRYRRGLSLDANGEATIRVSTPGRHRLSLRGSFTPRRGLTRNTGIGLENPEIVIEDTMSLQEFVLEPDRKRLEKVLEQLPVQR